jgi:hypothetical protein
MQRSNFQLASDRAGRDSPTARGDRSIADGAVARRGSIDQRGELLNA